MAQQTDLILLVVTVPLVNTGRGCDAIAFGHWGSGSFAVSRGLTAVFIDSGNRRIIKRRKRKNSLIPNHSSPQRLLIQLKIEHADLNALADKAVHAPHIDELLLKRLKKRRLQLRDRICRLEAFLMSPEPA